MFKLVDKRGEKITEEFKLGLLLYNNGTVCHDGFTANSADAICKVMGYDAASSWRSGILSSIQNSYNITLDNVVCSSPDWSNCTYRQHNDSDCVHLEDIFLSCGRACPPGSYRRAGQRRAGTCVTCPPNTYKSEAGIQTECRQCPTSSTSTYNSTKCTCSVGKFWNKTLCHGCKEGSVGRISSTGYLECSRCPSNSRPINNGTACRCRVGEYWEWTENITSCRRCPDSTTNTDRQIDLCYCRAGSYWNSTRCLPCADNSVSPDGAHMCAHCTLGPTDNSSCVCPNGTKWRWDERKEGSCVEVSSIGTRGGKKKTNLATLYAVFLGVMLLLTSVLLVYCAKYGKEQAKPAFISRDTTRGNATRKDTCRGGTAGRNVRTGVMGTIGEKSERRGTVKIVIHNSDGKVESEM